LLTTIWRSAHNLLGKTYSSLTIATGSGAVGFHPKFRIFCGDDVRATLVPLLAATRRDVGVSGYASSQPDSLVFTEKEPFGNVSHRDSMFTSP
jgi:hypothetical protein